MEAHDGHDVKSSPLLPLPVSSRSLGGSGGSWWTQSWCKLIGIIPQKLLWKLHQDPTSGTLSRLHLFYMSLPEVFMTKKFLMNLEIGSYWWQYAYEASMKSSSRSNIGNPVKNPPLLHVSLRSLKGHGGSWITWRCVQMNCSILMNLLWNFHLQQELYQGSMRPPCLFKEY